MEISKGAGDLFEVRLALASVLLGLGARDSALRALPQEVAASDVTEELTNEARVARNARRARVLLELGREDECVAAAPSIVPTR